MFCFHITGVLSSLDDYSSIGRYQLFTTSCFRYWLWTKLLLRHFYFEWAPKTRAEKLLSTFLAQQVISASAIFLLVLILNKIYSISDDLVLFAIAYLFLCQRGFCRYFICSSNSSAISFGLFWQNFLLITKLKLSIQFKLTKINWLVF